MDEKPPSASPPADNFGLPKWLEMPCSVCRVQMGLDRVLDIGVVLTPVFRGDLSVSYLCGKCSCLTEVRFRSIVTSVADFVRVLQAPDPPCAPRLYEDVIREPIHGQGHGR